MFFRIAENVRNQSEGNLRLTIREGTGLPRPRFGGSGWLEHMLEKTKLSDKQTSDDDGRRIV